MDFIHRKGQYINQWINREVVQRIKPVARQIGGIIVTGFYGPISTAMVLQYPKIHVIYLSSFVFSGFNIDRAADNNDRPKGANFRLTLGHVTSRIISGLLFSAATGFFPNRWSTKLLRSIGRRATICLTTLWTIVQILDQKRYRGMFLSNLCSGHLMEAIRWLNGTHHTPESQRALREKHKNAYCKNFKQPLDGCKYTRYKITKQGSGKTASKKCSISSFQWLNHYNCWTDEKIDKNVVSLVQGLTDRIKMTLGEKLTIVRWVPNTARLEKYKITCK